ncbi:DUF2849 domain-containing protein [Rhodovulum sp. 12E13]|uniref:DUF2849 domain-containing protein n=1 Tax=Rhodovulum sp. 12E13 TaxID=2203891 RepID=UPI000E198225|nr:DUF2849 domain-containing protein [Rhodovulum sp. 12E13]RDC71684.1 DUF2849 domain-containing protein [Rhodovulum sp. 12E13]
MPHSFRPSVVVAEGGPAGRCVFLTEAGGWTSDLAEAELIEDEAHGDIRLLEAACVGAGPRGSDVRLVEVRIGPHGPVSIREAVAPV